jgi:hypothetical protein
MFNVESCYNEYSCALIENSFFLTKNFQLHDICNYVPIDFLKNLNKIMTITNWINSFPCIGM